MSGPAENAGEPAEVWFPAGFKPRTVSPPPKQDDFEWVIPGAEPASAAPERAPTPRPRPSAVPREGVELDAGSWAPAPSPAERERLRADVQRAERRAETAEERAERAERALERSRAREAQRPAPQPPPSPAQREAPAPRETPEPVAARAAPRKPPQRANEGVDLNEATFENLRSLGLSVTQSARVISQRDQRGGFGSLDELDGMWGMPRDLIATLKSRCHV